MWDGIIIGRGLAGLLAGIRASERGKRILIISEGVGSLIQSSGALDFGDVNKLVYQENHPYALLGEKVVCAGINYFQELFEDYQSTLTSSHSLITPIGSIRKASIVPKGQNADVLQDARRIVLMAPEGMKDFFPEIVKNNLEKTYSQCSVEIYPFRVSAFESWYALGRWVTAMDYAKYWRSDQGITELTGLLNCMSQELCTNHFGQNKKTAVLFPGLTSAFSNPLKEVLSQIQVPVIEMTAFPPSPAGYYLNCALIQKFKSLGGELMVGNGVETIKVEGKLAAAAIVKSKGRNISFSARSFIIATGGLLGGGIAVTPETVQERLLDIPLYVPKEWAKNEFLGIQPYAYMGIEVDSELRPIDPGNNSVVLENVRIVGRTIAHWDPWVENCGGGVSLATGWLAGENI